MGAAEVDRLRTLYANWSRGDFRSDSSLFGHPGGARGSGMELDRPYILVWTFRDGELARVEEFVTREEALAAVGVE
jgi:hypothetical protein